MAETSPSLDRRRSDVQEERRRRRERWLIAIVSIAIAGFTYMEVRLSRFSGGLPVTNNLLFFGLVNVNVILTLLLVFLVFRNVAKLVFDRRSNALGARLRTKLILAFAGFTLVPAVLLFSVATGFVVNSVNSWFDPVVETSLGDALEVARLYYQRAEDDARRHAERISVAITEKDLLGSSRVDLERIVADKLQEHGADEVAIFDHEGRRLMATRGKGEPPPDLPEIDPDFIATGLAGTIATRTNTFQTSDVVRGVAPVWPTGCPEYSRTSGQSIRGCRPIGAVVAGRWVPESLQVRAAQIHRAHLSHKQIAVYESPLKTIYVTMLTTITLLVVFAATWLGLHLSREITVPLSDLANATQAVAQGNLDVVVPDPGSDEIGRVVGAFNKMTADLKASRAGLETANAELMAANVEVERRRRYLEVVLANVAAGVVAVDREGRFTAMNDAAVRLLAIPPESVLGRKYREVLPEAYLDVTRDLLRELESGISVSRQVSISIHGEMKNVMVTATALRDVTLGYLGLVVVLDDLTPILRAQRVAAWREVARRIAHEIKNPLTPVQLSAQRLRRRFASQIVEGREVFDECTQTIEKQVEDLRRMVNEFSEFARMPEAAPRPGDLNATVREAVTLYGNAHEGTTRIAFTPGGDVPVFDLDPEQVKRAVINLLENACVAVQDGGGSEVVITTSYERALGIVRLTVADDGPGMSAEVKARLFEPYFSTKKGGTGLGLTIVHRIVADHEGFIRVQDNVPRGTRFVLEFPAKTAGHKEPGREAANQ